MCIPEKLGITKRNPWFTCIIKIAGFGLTIQKYEVSQMDFNVKEVA